MGVQTVHTHCCITEPSGQITKHPPLQILFFLSLSPTLPEMEDAIVSGGAQLIFAITT